MKITISNTDGTVGIDKIFYPIDTSSLPKDLRVVQWDGKNGHEEWINKPNSTLTDVKKYQALIDKWIEEDNRNREKQKNKFFGIPKAQVEREVEASIKAVKENKRNSGVYLPDDTGTKRWFQTDLQSKVVYLIVVQTKSSMIWRTMDKENITLSDSLALRILQAVLEKESILDDVEENHINKMKTSSRSDEYNYLVGWPNGYKG